MITSTTLPTVRIIRVPQGPLPLEVRQKWLDLRLPAAFAIDEVEFSQLLKQEVNCCGVYVEFDRAVDALKDAGHIATAQWLKIQKKHGDCYLVFRSDEVEVVDGSKLIPAPSQHIRQYLGLLEVGVGAHDHWANQPTVSPA